jgi:hypothetical protein
MDPSRGRMGRAAFVAASIAIEGSVVRKNCIRTAFLECNIVGFFADGAAKKWPLVGQLPSTEWCV